MECVNHFCDTYAPKVRKSLSQHKTFRTVWKLSRPSGNFPHCLEIFPNGPELSKLSRNFPGRPETFQPVWKLSRSSGNFPNCPKTCKTALKLSRQSANFPHLFTLQLMFRLNFMGNFVNTRKTFRMTKNFLVGNADAPTMFLGPCPYLFNPCSIRARERKGS